MFKPLMVILLYVFIIICRADLCQYNFTLGELPEGILNEVLSLLLTGTLEEFTGCPDDITVSTNKINLWLWNQHNPDTPILLEKNNPFQINSELPTIMIIPGWLCNVTNDKMPELKTAYLQKFGDANIIGVDWFAYSYSLYSDAFCYVPLIAPIIGEFICNLNSNFNIDIGQLKLVGHSMGAQMLGLIGQETKKQCNHVLGRIIAADPAGPLYQTLSASHRLDETDASQVEVIHSNQAQFGFYGACGSVDFFPNCGYFQTGCLRISAETDRSDLLNLLVEDVACNHLRSIEYVAESVNSNLFTSKSCDTCPGLPLDGPCILDLMNPSQVPMGEPCPSNPPDTKYFLTTNGVSPYAKG